MERLFSRRGHPPRDDARADGRTRAPGGRRASHRRAREPDLRRRSRTADRLGRRGRALRARAAGAVPRHDRRRQRPGADAHGPDPGDRPRAHARGPLDRRDRPVRDQRGVRARRARLAARHRRAAREDERERRRDRTRPSAGRDGRTPADEPAARAGAHRGPVRPADDVRRRRPGECDDHRAARLA